MVKNYFVLILLFLTLFLSTAGADVLVSYDYNSGLSPDPTAQGWELKSTYSGSSPYVGAYNTAEIWPDSKLPKGWRVIDGTSGGYIYYQTFPTVTAAAAMRKSWTATWTFSMDADGWGTDGTTSNPTWTLPPNQATQAYSGLLIDVAGADGYAYYMVATADGNGNLAIWDRKDGSSSVAPTHVLTSEGNNVGYDKMYTVTIKYDGKDAVLSYGGKDFTLYKFPSRNVDRVIFGGISTPARGSLVFEKILIQSDASVSTKPKPAITAAESKDVLNISGDRQLFVDKYIIDSMAGDIELQMHEAVDKGKVLDYTEPWEGRAAYNTIIKDGDKYLLYYRAYRNHPQDYPKTIPVENICYAESTDGINWVKPSLGICEYEGSKENNIILRDEPTRACHNLAPFIDTNPNADKKQRFKALGGTWKTGYSDKKRLYAYSSPDGIHWKLMQEEPVLVNPGWAYDSMNISFWSEDEGRYVLFYREGIQGKRSIGKAVSDDYLNWTNLGMMKYSDTGSTIPSCQFYTNQTQPYFRAPQIYLSTPARFFEHRQVLTEDQAKAINVDPRYFKDTSDVGFMTTRPGSMMYDRTFMSALLGPGIGIENWVSRSNYPAPNIVPTSDTEMSLYVKKNNAQPTVHLRRYAYRIDGIASASAGYDGGELLTKPFTFEGNRLFLNYSTSAAGSIKVEFQEIDGTPITGFSARESRVLIGDEIDREFNWGMRKDVKELQGRAVRLKFIMKDADIYSFVFK